MKKYIYNSSNIVHLTGNPHIFGVQKVKVDRFMLDLFHQKNIAVEAKTKYNSYFCSLTNLYNINRNNNFNFKSPNSKFLRHLSIFFFLLPALKSPFPKNGFSRNFWHQIINIISRVFPKFRKNKLHKKSVENCGRR